jgi:hypothetical protein
MLDAAFKDRAVATPRIDHVGAPETVVRTQRIVDEIHAPPLGGTGQARVRVRGAMPFLQALTELLDILLRATRP